MLKVRAVAAVNEISELARASSCKRNNMMSVTRQSMPMANGYKLRLSFDFLTRDADRETLPRLGIRLFMSAPLERQPLPRENGMKCSETDGMSSSHSIGCIHVRGQGFAVSMRFPGHYMVYSTQVQLLRWNFLYFASFVSSYCISKVCSIPSFLCRCLILSRHASQALLSSLPHILEVSLKAGRQSLSNGGSADVTCVSMSKVTAVKSSTIWSGPAI